MEKVKGRRKSDSRVTWERDGGGVSTALEGKEKHRLTGEPVRIDRPASSCHWELIWHQQSLCVKQERTGGPLHMAAHVQLWPGPSLSSFNEQHVTTTEDTRTREWLSSHTHADVRVVATPAQKILVGSTAWNRHSVPVKQRHWLCVYPSASHIHAFERFAIRTYYNLSWMDGKGNRKAAVINDCLQLGFYFWTNFF